KLGNQKRDAQKLSDQSLGEEAPVNPPLQKHDPIAKQTPIAQTKTEKRGKKYENVPAEKRDQILKRIQLCETLFMESGRAYDYREMTTAELEGELVAVRQSKAQVVDSYASQEMGSLEADPLFEKDPILNPDLAPEVE